MYLKALEEQQVVSPNHGRWENKIRIKKEFNQTEIKRTVPKIEKVKNWFLETKFKNGMPFPNLSKTVKERIQIQIRYKKVATTTDSN